MTLDTFPWRVSPEVLDRGLHYQREGRVHDLEEESPLTYRARVRGSQDYHVRVVLSSEGEILTSTCDCPYQGGPVCKHQVAVYQAISEVFAQGSQEVKPEDRRKTLVHLPLWRQRELLLDLKGQLALTPEDHTHAERHEGLMRFYRELSNAESEVAFDRLVASVGSPGDPLAHFERLLLIRTALIDRKGESPETLEKEIQKTVTDIARASGDQAATLLEMLFSPRVSEEHFRLSLLGIFLDHTNDLTRRHQAYNGLRVMHMYAHGEMRRAIGTLMRTVHPEKPELQKTPEA